MASPFQESFAALFPQMTALIPKLTPEQQAQENIVKQILGQGTSSKWSGQGLGSAEANAKDMARILNSIGITDISQFGKVPVLQEVRPLSEQYNGMGVDTSYDEKGQPYRVYIEPIGVDTYGETITRRVKLPEGAKLTGIYGETGLNGAGEEITHELANEKNVIRKDGKYYVQSGETFGNKLTGQAVPITYDERQRGEFFGGTYAGEGNTGYGVQFDAQGNPYFYTQAASSSNANKYAPLLAAASFIPGVAPFAQAINAAVAIDQGNPLSAIASLAGLGDYAGISGAADVANVAKLGSAIQSGDPLAMLMSGANVGGVTDIGGVDLKDVSKGIGAIKAIESGDPLAIIKTAMGYAGGSNADSPNSSDFIEGYFQPGGEGYIAPTGENVFDPTFGGVLPMPTDTSGQTPTGPGVYNEITGEFIPGEGPLQGPLGPETGNIDPDQKWEYSLTKPGVWTNEAGEEIDLSYMPDQDTAMTGKELMERAGAMPGGSKAPTKAPTAPAKPASPTKPGATTNPAATPGATTPTGTTPNAASPTGTSGASQGQPSVEALLNLMGSNNQLAKIKSAEDIFGAGIFATPQKPVQTKESKENSSEAEQSSEDGNYFNGGHVDDFSVNALLRTLRS